jgi:hypothetical protein
VILGVYLTHQQIRKAPRTQELDGSSQDHKAKTKEELKRKRHKKFIKSTNWNWSQPKVVGQSGDPSSNKTIQLTGTIDRQNRCGSRGTRGNYLKRKKIRSSKQERLNNDNQGVTTGIRVFVECSELCRVLFVGHSAKKPLPSAAFSKVPLSVTTLFAESRTLDTGIHSANIFCRVPNTRRWAALGKGSSAAI